MFVPVDIIWKGLWTKFKPLSKDSPHPGIPKGVLLTKIIPSDLASPSNLITQKIAMIWICRCLPILFNNRENPNLVDDSKGTFTLESLTTEESKEKENTIPLIPDDFRDQLKLELRKELLERKKSIKITPQKRTFSSPQISDTPPLKRRKLQNNQTVILHANNDKSPQSSNNNKNDKIPTIEEDKIPTIEENKKDKMPTIVEDKTKKSNNTSILRQSIEDLCRNSNIENKKKESTILRAPTVQLPIIQSNPQPYSLPNISNEQLYKEFIQVKESISQVMNEIHLLREDVKQIKENNVSALAFSQCLSKLRFLEAKMSVSDIIKDKQSTNKISSNEKTNKNKPPLRSKILRSQTSPAPALRVVTPPKIPSIKRTASGTIIDFEDNNKKGQTISDKTNDKRQTTRKTKGNYNKEDDKEPKTPPLPSDSDAPSIERTPRHNLRTTKSVPQKKAIVIQ